MIFTQVQLITGGGVFITLCGIGVVTTGQAGGWLIAVAGAVIAASGAILWRRERRF
ncbi:LPXTG cell wall anchor domain-containing protein [Rathayibacter sp. AY1E6]|uniref:LPXTG cell wall anchor domain-containing protein n=1 Tax=Rathayibacter sp. AY1E6 TaxID=2080554 RepID=UPI0015E3AF46|nr:LPXTG cell wall anchor domain-containing protein [Rathayibacter sp. AY1E6]